MRPVEIQLRGLFTRTIVVDDTEVVRGRVRLAWTEVDHYRYAMPDIDRPGDFVLVTTGNRIVRLEPVFDHWHQLAERVFAALHPRLRARPWFAPFELAGDVLRFGRLPDLPLADIEVVELVAVGNAVTVEVRRRGGGRWAEVELAEIANAWLWLEALVARGVAIRSALDFDLPVALAELELRLRAARRLPPARVVR